MKKLLGKFPGIMTRILINDKQADNDIKLTSKTASVSLKMSCSCCVILCICFYSLSGITLSSEKESFAFTGCNAVLEWNLGLLSEFEVLTTTVSIKDNNGSVIISHKENRCSCQDAISMKCIVSERDGKFFISVIIYNVTKEHRGNFTALIKQGIIKRSVQKQLLVIDKPQIVENKMPVLHESFSVTCNTSYEVDCLTYHWRKNGVYQNYTASIQGDSSTLTFANLTMMDNSSKLKCQVGIEKCTDVDFTNRNCSSKESDLYTVLPSYGPFNVSLNINKSDIYLVEKQTFRVKCSAACFPKCTFRWKGFYINVEEEELKISSFVSRMSGGYACIVKNRITDATVESNPFFLHYVQDVTVFSSPPGENQEIESFAFIGCDAVLEWNLGFLSEFEVLTTTVSIKDKNGSVIILHKENRCSCQDAISMKCIVSERDGKFFISVIIFNVTKEHRGNFTALIKQGISKRSVQKQLLVIDKPQIVENKMPVLHESFSVTCNTSYEVDCLTYHWRKNGVYQNYTASIQGDSSTLTFANLTMMDNSSKLKCQVGREKCTDVDFTNRNCSSKESDLYTVLPLYGPFNVSLYINESHIYLMEKQTFRVKCSADCFPKCTFRWKGFYINVEEEELKISSFVPRMSGGYACIVKNRITDATVESNPFFLHYVKDVTVFSSPPGENQGPRAEEYWLVPEQYWLVPIIVSGFLLTAGFVIFFKYWRKIAARGNGRRPVLLYATENGEKNNATFYPDTGTQSQDLNNSIHDNCAPNLQEDIYTTIDESAESVYCYARDELSEKNLNETGSSTGHGYNTSMEMCPTVKADVHVPDEGNEGYLTPLSDLSSHVDMSEKWETNPSGADQTTITPINELFCPNEAHVCQDEKIEVPETDHSYITPIV